jgi:LacI family transcriptional regulator
MSVRKRTRPPSRQSCISCQEDPVRPVNRHVALLIETSNAYARGLMHGIVSYIREHRRWSIYLAEHSRGDRPPAWLIDWDGDGVIARIENPAIAEQVKRLRVPVVDVSAARLIPALPWVETDDKAIARLAAEHLLERGFRQFGFCGDERFNWSRWRRDHFEQRVREAGHACSVYAPVATAKTDPEKEVTAIAQWVAALPKPVGILACYDFRGQQLLDACRRQGIAVPDDVAVLGVDNDELLCDLTDPPMSSVILNTHRTGYQAAELLDRMMSGERLKPEAHLIEPLGIATRQSTDVLAIEDPNIVAVVRFIREHACEGISMKEVLRALPQSRRLLEARFQKLLGRTPHEEIMRVRLNRAKLLLAESDLTLERIAELTGFVHVEYFSVVFRRETGLPPSRYRAASHGNG